jgi:hypothetical protein
MLSAKPNYFEKRRSDISSLDHLPDFLKCARKARGEPDGWEFARPRSERRGQ